MHIPSTGSDVPAVSRAIRLLETIGAAELPLTLAELTAILGYPKSSLLGICVTLVRGGFLRRSEDGRYTLGARLVGLAHSYLASSTITSHFFETWDALDAMPGETVVLSVLDGTDVVYVACRNGTQGLTFSYRIGMRLPASCTASGKAILSTLAPGALERVFRGKPLQLLTPKSLRDVEALQADLQLVRERGYAVDEQAVREGMCCIGAPIFEQPGGSAAAAVAVSLLSAEFRAPEKRAQAIETVTRFADELTRRLCGSVR
jgi:DNA-binding IclR family transcriptional regulator